MRREQPRRPSRACILLRSFPAAGVVADVRADRGQGNRRQLSFYAGYARQLERAAERRGGEKDSGPWGRLWRSEERWAGWGTLATTYRLAAQFCFLLPRARPTPLARRPHRARCRRAPRLTWDQGHEMAKHARFTVDTRIAVYFCDPKSPWQRGSNENTNDLLRQYLPRHISMQDFTQADLDRIAAEVNGRPRQTLGFKSPSEALAEMVAMTA